MNITMDKSQPPAPTQKERFPLSLLCLTLGAFAIGMTEFIIMGLLPNVARDLGVSIPQAGQLITCYALGVAIGAPVLTIFTHRLPQKKLLMILMCIFICGNAVSVIAPTYTLLILARILTAFAHGTFLGLSSIPWLAASLAALALAGAWLSYLSTRSRQAALTAGDVGATSSS